MKHLILIILIGLGTSAVCQTEQAPFPNIEFGFNGTTILSNLLPFGDNFSINEIDNLLFFKIGNGRTYFRSAINLDYENSTNENAEFSQSLALVKLGFERKRALSKSWIFHSGAEIIGRTLQNNTTTTDPFVGDFESKTSSNSIGISGIYGIQWRINNKLAIGTEGYISGIFTENKTTNEFPGGPPSSDNKTEDMQVRILLPRSILVSFYF